MGESKTIPLWTCGLCGRKNYMATENCPDCKVRIEGEQNPNGELNPKMICPHCQEKGMIRTVRISQKTGISGGKATAAILTAGWSLLVSGAVLDFKQEHYKED